ncbi:hypothetical protein [Alicyclobacillus shizuokensis]|uniref:hypothetical protein n=1 Tax=Alicyclobacillus shizuokensis TaxID=392014 RepID=UPI0008336AAE|nr:hypothetical protein [Alicyclobacillus shizuokensis]
MKGTIYVESIDPNQKVFVRPVDHPDFPNHWIVLEPFRGWYGERLFDVYKDGDKLAVEGELYIYASEAPARDHAREVCEEVDAVKYVERGILPTMKDDD